MNQTNTRGTDAKSVPECTGTSNSSALAWYTSARRVFQSCSLTCWTSTGKGCRNPSGRRGPAFPASVTGVPMVVTASCSGDSLNREAHGGPEIHGGRPDQGSLSGHAAEIIQAGPELGWPAPILRGPVLGRQVQRDSRKSMSPGK